MSLQYANISHERPLVINSYQEMLGHFVAVMRDAGVLPANEKPDVQQEWVSSEDAKKMLAAKGYQVTSNPAMREMVKQHNITKEKRGRVNWYSVADIKNVPSKNIL